MNTITKLIPERDLKKTFGTGPVVNGFQSLTSAYGFYSEKYWRWCRDNCGSETDFYPVRQWVGGQHLIVGVVCWFEDDTDALMFELRWR